MSTNLYDIIELQEIAKKIYSNMNKEEFFKKIDYKLHIIRYLLEDNKIEFNKENAIKFFLELEFIHINKINTLAYNERYNETAKTLEDLKIFENLENIKEEQFKIKNNELDQYNLYENEKDKKRSFIFQNLAYNLDDYQTLRYKDFEDLVLETLI